MSTVVYAWVLDGIPTIFVTGEELDATWAVAQGFVDTAPGLKLPKSLPVKVNLRRLILDDVPTTIKVDDLDDSFAALFGTSPSTAADLIATLEPATDPAPASIRGKHVGLEFISSAGARRRYSCVPAYNVGLKHLGALEAYANQASPTPVSDTPTLWTGRRCAVYRVVQAADGTWPTLANSTRVWWGTMRTAGTQHKKTWAFPCLGPDSWHGGNLATGNFENPLRVQALVTLTDADVAGPTVIRGSLDIVQLQDNTNVLYTYVEVGDAAGTTNMGTVTGYAAIAAGVNTHLDGMKAAGGAGSYDVNGNDLSYSTLFGADGIAFLWAKGDTTAIGDPQTDNTAIIQSYTARLRLIMHASVWLALGYDVDQQNSSRDPEGDEYGQFESVGFPSGYWQGLFYAANGRAMKGFEENDFGPVVKTDYDSGGQTRTWAPLYQGGTHMFSGEVQEFILDTADELRLAASKSRPIAADLDDPSSAHTLGGTVGLVTAQAVMVLQGPRRTRRDDDTNSPADGYAFDISRQRREGFTVQPVRVAWRASSAGLVATDSDNYPRFVIMEWLTPRSLAFDYEPLSGDWGGHREPPEGAQGITAQPLAVWDYSEGGDKVSTVVRRLLLTTGTAVGWTEDAGFVTPLYGLGADEAYLEVGDNDDGGDVPGDADDAAMGLAIPSSMVAAASVWDSVGQAPGPHLGRCKAVSAGTTSGTDLIARLLAPTGIALGLGGGKYTPFDAWLMPTPGDAVVTLTTEDYALTPGRDPASAVPLQQSSLWAPIDEVTIEATREPLAGDYHKTLHRSAGDVGARSRSQHLTHTARGDFLVHSRLSVPGGSWQQNFPSRWDEGVRFWGSRLSVVTIPVHSSSGLNLWPGDGVLLTDPWLVGLGVYSLSIASARVIGRNLDCTTEVVKLTLLVDTENEFRMWAPSAVVTQYDETDPFRLVCEDDHLGDRGGGLDVSGFIEPSWSTEGGAATLEVFSFDGSTWAGGIYGTVSSLGTTPGSTYIELTGALTGATWYPDRHHVVMLREWANQSAAWVKRWHAPICAKDGTHTGALAGIKFRQL